ncbi:MAG: glycosyltransferase [Alistipes sp.]
MEISLPTDQVVASPRVTICMITYNHAAYIGQAIEGILHQQSAFPFEILIGEDCSTDQTRSICQHYQALHPDKIRLLLPEKNLGMITNFYTTLQAATGEYIAFCEGDDYWIDPLKLQKQVDFLDAHPDFGCVYTDFDMRYQQSGKVQHSLFHTRPQRYPLHTDLASFICHPLYLAPCTWLLRRDLLNKPLPSTVDGSFVLFAHLFSQSKIHFLPDTTAVYRRLPESASHTTAPEKLYQRESGLRATQFALIDTYGLPESAKEPINNIYYRRHLRLFILLGKEEELAAARCFFKGKHIRFSTRFLLILSSTAWGRWLIGWSYKK